MVACVLRFGTPVKAPAVHDRAIAIGLGSVVAYLTIAGANVQR